MYLAGLHSSKWSRRKRTLATGGGERGLRSRAQRRDWPWEHRKLIHHETEGRLSKKGPLGWVYPAERLETVDASIFSVNEKPGFLLVPGR